MSNENRFTDRPFEYPAMSVFDVEFGERMGELSAGQQHMRSDIQRLETRIDVLEAKMESKFDALDDKTDKMAYALNRLDERTKSLQSQVFIICGGTFVAVVAGLILQYLK